MFLCRKILFGDVFIFFHGTDILFDGADIIYHDVDILNLDTVILYAGVDTICSDADILIVGAVILYGGTVVLYVDVVILYRGTTIFLLDHNPILPKQSGNSCRREPGLFQPVDFRIDGIIKGAAEICLLQDTIFKDGACQITICKRNPT